MVPATQAVRGRHHGTRPSCELRYRLIVSVAGVVLVSIVCLAFYDDLLGILMRPINEAVATYQARNPGKICR